MDEITFLLAAKHFTPCETNCFTFILDGCTLSHKCQYHPGAYASLVPSEITGEGDHHVFDALLAVKVKPHSHPTLYTVQGPTVPLSYLPAKSLICCRSYQVVLHSTVRSSSLHLTRLATKSRTFAPALHPTPLHTAHAFWVELDHYVSLLIQSDG
jgi:hypothetical protein